MTSQWWMGAIPSTAFRRRKDMIKNWKVGDRVIHLATGRVGVIIYINPDNKLAEVKFKKEFDWAEMFKPEDLSRRSK